MCCCVLQAAEQAKASPALVAKDPATSTTKKEEEDLAKGAPLRQHFCSHLIFYSILYVLWQKKKKKPD